MIPPQLLSEQAGKARGSIAEMLIKKIRAALMMGWVGSELEREKIQARKSLLGEREQSKAIRIIKY